MRLALLTALLLSSLVSPALAQTANPLSNGPAKLTFGTPDDGIDPAITLAHTTEPKPVSRLLGRGAHMSLEDRIKQQFTDPKEQADRLKLLPKLEAKYLDPINQKADADYQVKIAAAYHSYFTDAELKALAADYKSNTSGNIDAYKNMIPPQFLKPLMDARAGVPPSMSLKMMQGPIGKKHMAFREQMAKTMTEGMIRDWMPQYNAASTTIWSELVPGAVPLPSDLEDAISPNGQ
jgi:hypothetical protein